MLYTFSAADALTKTRLLQSYCHSMVQHCGTWLVVSYDLLRLPSIKFLKGSGISLPAVIQQFSILLLVSRVFLTLFTVGLLPSLGQPRHVHQTLSAVSFTNQRTWYSQPLVLMPLLVTTFSKFIVFQTLSGPMLFVVFVFLIYPIRKILLLSSVSNSSTIITCLIAVCCIFAPLLVCALVYYTTCE